MKGFWKQVIRFIGFSGIGWLLDFTTYMLLGFRSDNLILNNIISSWVGFTFVFVFATRKIFENKGTIPLSCKYLIYFVYQCGLIFVVSKLLDIFSNLIVENFEWVIICSFASIIAKILVTPITMILNFFVMKSVIEKLS